MGLRTIKDVITLKWVALNILVYAGHVVEVIGTGTTQ